MLVPWANDTTTACWGRRHASQASSLIIKNKKRERNELLELLTKGRAESTSCRSFFLIADIFPCVSSDDFAFKEAE